ncbi:MAG: hypothetical protein ACFFEJ_00040 [Candidatus Thorarchaeota archaeon]
MNEKRPERITIRYPRYVRGNVIHWHPEPDATRPFYHKNSPESRLRITRDTEWVSCKKCLEGLVKDKHIPPTELDVVTIARRKAMARDRPV